MDAILLSSVYEAYGLVILEAMAAGLPVLGRRADHPRVMTACEEIITHGHDGLLFHAHDPGSLARSITALAHAPAWCRTLGSNARRTAIRQSWHQYAQQVMALLLRSPSPLPPASLSWPEPLAVQSTQKAA
jgi:glycosyltransferase involved in cell wall biosynthesis